MAKEFFKAALRLCGMALPFVMLMLLPAAALASYLPVGAGGNIGIGTTTATEKLEVIGTVKATRFIGDGSGLTGLTTGAGWTELGSNVYLTTGSNNVGIGSSLPQTKLDVQGGAAAGSRIVNVNGTFADLGGSRAGLYVDVTAGTTGPGGPVGSWSEVRTTANSGTYTNAITGAYGEALHAGSATADHLVGMMAVANQYGNGNVSNAYGLMPEVWKGDGTVTNAFGLYFQGVPNINPDTLSGAGTVVNQYGLAINRLTMGTTRNVALLLDDNVTGAAATGNFGIYEEAGNPNYFTGNIGIGTSAPAGKLALYSTANANLVDVHEVTDTTGTYSNESQYKVGTAGQNRATPSDVQNFRFFSGYGGFQEVVKVAVTTPAVNAGNVVGAMDFYTQGPAGVLDKRMTLNNVGAAFQNGNVGINTTAPQAKLDVEGDVYVGNGNVGIGTLNPRQKLDIRSGAISLDTGGAIYWYASAVNGARIQGGSGGSNNYLAFFTNNAVRLLIDHDGNIGIGSSEPLAILDVEGNVYFGSGNVGIGSSAPVNLLDVTGTGGAAAGIHLNDAVPASTNMALYNEAGTLKWNGNALATGASVSGTQGYIPRFTSSSALGDSVIYQDAVGNIGIGSSAPQAKLELVGAGTTSATAALTILASDKTPRVAVYDNGNVMLGTVVPNDTGANLYVQGLVGTASGPGNNWGQYRIGTGSVSMSGNGGNTAGDFLSLNTRYAARLHINGSGNVGIGSTSPQVKLDVAGNLYVGDGGVAGNGNVGIGSSSPAQKLDVQGSGYFSGNLGVGTSDPRAKLEVDGSILVKNTVSANDTLRLSPGAGSGQIYFVNGVDNITGRFYNSAGSTFIGLQHNGTAGNIYSSSGPLVFQSGAGNLGVGTTVPQAKIDVEGSAYFGNGNIGVGSAAPSEKIDVIGTVKATAFIGDGSGLTGIATGGGWTRTGTDIYTTTGSDNVGIGSNVPQTKLDVNGTIYTPGNVGIGVPSTDYKLDIRGGTDAFRIKHSSETILTGGLFLVPPTWNGDLPAFIRSYSNTGLDLMTQTTSGAVNNPRISLVSSDSIRFYFDTANEADPYTNPGNWAEKFRFTWDGNLGVGSAVPSQKVDVIGTVKATAFIGDGSGLSGLSGTISGLNAGYLSKASSSTTIDDSAIYQSGSNIGIGSTSPQAKLDVKGNSSFGGGNVYVDGNIGIGTSAPAARLQLASGQLLVPDGSQGAPSIAISSQPDTGFYFTPTSIAMVMQGGALSPRFLLTTSDVTLPDVRFNGGGTASISNVSNGDVWFGTNSAEVFRIKNTGNLGVGTIAPQQKVEVLGTVKATGFIGDGSGLTNISGSISGLNTGYIPRAASATTISDSAIYQDSNGNIGIGTTTPQHQMEVTGSLSIAKDADWTGIYAGAERENVGLHYGAFAWRTTTNPNRAELYTGNYTYPLLLNNSLWIDTAARNGNIGINSSVPQAKLDVQGDAFVSGNVGIGTTDTTYGIVQVGPGGVVGAKGAFASFGKGVGVDNGTNAVVFGYSPQYLSALGGSSSSASTFLTNNAYLSSSITDTFAHSNTNSSPLMIWMDGFGQKVIDFKSSPSAAAGTEVSWSTKVRFDMMSGNVGIGSTLPQARLDVEGSAYFGNGNVGIGSSAPGHALDVKAQSTYDGVFTDGIVSSDGLFLYGGGNGLFKTSVSYGGYQLINDKDLRMYTGAAGDLIVSTNGDLANEAMRVVASKNVGIGSSVPQSKLDVEGGAYFGNGNIGVGSAVPSQSVDVLGTVKATAFIGDGSGLTGLSAAGGWSNVGSNVYVTDASNNVGIGTSVPLSKLDLVGAGTTSATTAVSIRASDGASRVTVLDNGNVGIGTSNPTSAFKVGSGTSFEVTSTGLAYGYSFSDPRAGGRTFSLTYVSGLLLNDAGNVSWSGTNDFSGAKDVLVRRLSAGVLEIDKSSTLGDLGTLVIGNVGIGTTAPQAKLDVEGSAYFGNGNVGIGTFVPASPLHVTSTTGSNGAYVFESSGGNGQAALYAYSVNGTGLRGETDHGNGAGVEGIAQRGLAGRFLQNGTIFSTVSSPAVLIERSTNLNGNDLTGPVLKIDDTTASTGALLAITEQANTRFVVANGGNIGIGSSLPQGRLDVEGSAYFGNGNVGLGSSAPVNLLDVTGTGGAAAGIHLNDAVPSSTNMALYNEAGTLKWNGTALATGASVSGTQGYISRFTSPSALGDSAIYQNGANIGIGTTAGTAALAVYGDLRFTKDADNVIYGADTNHLVLQGGDSNGTGRGIILRADTDLANGVTNFVNVLSADERGVSLGEVTGDFGYLNGPGAANLAIRTGDVNGVDKGMRFLVDTNPANSAVNYVEVINIPSSGNVGINSSVPQAKLDVEGSVYIGNGNVGIGSSAPAAKLEVYEGVTNVATRIDDGSIIFTRDDGFVGGYVSSASNGTSLTVNSSGQVALFPNNRYALIAATPDGNYAQVAIGDASPAVNGARLQIQGSFAAGTGYAPLTTVPADGAIIQGNVGIGSYVPQAKLDVEGSAYFGNGNIGVGSAAPSQAVDVLGTVRATAFIGDGSGLTGITGTTQWTTNGTAIYYNTGNVGIGSSVPQSKLDAQGDITSSGSIAAANDLAFGQNLKTGNMIMAAVGSGNLWLGDVNGGGNGLALYTNGAQRARIDVGGNVGINSVAPQAKLDVEGNVYFGNGNIGVGSSLPAARLDVQANIYEDGIRSHVITDFSSPIYAVYAYGQNGAAEGVYGISDNSYAIHGYAGAGTAVFGDTPRGTSGYFQQAGAIFSTYNSPTLVAYRNTTLGGNDMTGAVLRVEDNSASSGNLVDVVKQGANKFIVYNNGNVGISSSVPQAKLDVEGDVYIGNGNIGIGTTDTSGNKLKVNGNVYADSIWGETGLTSGSHITLTNDYASLRFNGGSGMGISADGTANHLNVSGGNFGINSTAPQARLDVEGNIYIGDGGTAGSGNVGVGSVTPTQKVDVIGTVKATAFIGDGSGLTGITGTTQWSNGAASAIYYNSGNVGIGSSAPNRLLDVAGYIQTSQGYLFGPGGSTSILGTGYGIGADEIYFRTEWTDRMVIRDDGNIGINSIVPQAKLDVEGSVYFGNGNVGVGSGAPEYKLAVAGDIKASNYFYVSNSGDWGGYRFGGGSASIFGRGGHTPSDYIGFETRYVQRMIIDSVGNIGISSGTPQAKLDVAGNVYIGDGGTAGSGNVGVGSVTPTQKVDVIGTVKATAFIGDGSGLTGITGTTQWSNGAASAIYYNSGNVGIGSANPANRFVVADSSRAVLDLTDTGGVGDSGLINFNSDTGTRSQIWGGNDNAGKQYISFNVPGGSGASHNLTWWYNTTSDERLGVSTTKPSARVDIDMNTAVPSVPSLIIAQAGGNPVFYVGSVNQSGNVGVGTSWPQARLDVEGNAYFGNGNVGIGTSAPDTLLNIGNGTPTTAASGLQFGSDASANLYRTSGSSIKTDGYFYALSIASANGVYATGGNFQATNDVAAHFGTGQRNGENHGLSTNVFAGQAGVGSTDKNGGDLLLQSGTSTGSGTSNIYFQTAAAGSPGVGVNGIATKMSILGNGNVGISSLYPQAKLDVEGGAYFGNGNVGVGTVAPVEKIEVIGTVKATAFIGDGSGLTGLPASGGWTRTGANVYVTTATDNVGIGTSAAASKLHVSGALTIDTTTTTNYVSPNGANIPTKINVPNYDPGNYGQILAMGIPAGSWATARVMTLLDARAGTHQPTLEVLSPDENGIFGLSWNGSNTQSWLVSNKDILLAPADGNAVNVRLPQFGSSTTLTDFTQDVTHAGLLINANYLSGSYTPGLFWATNDNNPTKPKAGIFMRTTDSAGSYLHLATSNSYATGLTNNGLVIDPEGNVGVNSVAPQAKLDVEGNVYFGGGNVGIGTTDFSHPLTVGDFGSASDTRVDIHSGSVYNESIVFYPSGSYGNEIGNFREANGNRYFQIRGNSNNPIVSVGVGSSNTFNVGIGTIYPEAKLDVEGGAYFGNGNVGVGSVAPTEKVDVVGTVKATAFIGDGSGLTGISGVTQWSNGAASAIYYNAGNVGIGSSGPGAKLHVSYTGSTDATLPAGEWAMQVDNNVDNVGNPNGLLVATRYGVANSTIFEAGRMWNGTGVAYNSILKVTGDGLATVGQDSNGSLVMPFVLKNAYDFAGSGTGLLFHLGAHYKGGIAYIGDGGEWGRGDMYFMQNATAAVTGPVGPADAVMVIKNNGNVGINSTAPQAKLDVEGNVYVGNGNIGIGTADPLRPLHILGAVTGGVPPAAIALENVSGASEYIQFVNDSANGGGNVDAFIAHNGSAGGMLEFMTGGSLSTDYSRIAITYDGLVGIGTTSPGGKLVVYGGNVGVGTTAPSQAVDVIGTVKATAFIGDGSGLTGLPANSGWTRTGTNVYTTTATDNVGIGTSLPSILLEVKGQDSLTTDVLMRLTNNGTHSNTGTAIDFYNNHTLNGPYARIAATVGDSWNNSYLSFQIQGPEVMRLSQGGNVGINSAAPQAKLDVEGTSYFGGNIGIGTTDTSVPLDVYGGWTNWNGLVRTINSAGEFTALDPEAGVIFQRSSGYITQNRPGGNLVVTVSNVAAHDTSAMTFISNGNIGINSMFPQAKLDVEGGAYFGNGNIGVGSSVPSQKIDVVGTVKATAFIGDGSGLTGVGSQWTTNGLDIYYSTGNVGIGSSVPTAPLQVSGAIASTSLSARAAAGIAVYGETNSGSPAVEGFNQSSGSGVLATSTSGFGLEASTTANYAGYLASEYATTNDIKDVMDVVRSTTGTASAGIGSGLKFGIEQASGGVSDAARISAIWTDPVFVSRTSALTFETINNAGALTEAMRITGVGNVGIGTSVPAAKLHVEGDVYFGGGNVGIGSSLPLAKMEVRGTYSGGRDIFSVTNQWSGSMLKVDQWAHVGIGVEIPGASLDVSNNNGSGTAGIFRSTDGTSSNGVSIQTQTTNATDFGLLVRSNGGANTTFRVQADGNVGISSSVPQAKLDVEGNVYFGNGNVGIGSTNPPSPLYVRNTAGTSVLTAIFHSAADNLSYVDGWGNYYSAAAVLAPAGPLVSDIVQAWGTDSAFRVTANGTGDLLLQSNSTGNVGINSSVPQAKLDVEGGAYFGNGNVGIGSSAPQTSLDIVGPSGTVGNYFHLTNGFGGGANLWMGSSGAGINLTTDSDLGITDQWSASRLFIKGASGNVGINTTGPSERLDVVGTVKATAFIGDGSGLTGLSSGAWTRTGTNVYVTSLTDNVGIGTITPQARLDVVGAGTTSATASLIIHDSTNAAKVAVLDNGNIGVGTASPASLLDFGTSLLSNSVYFFNFPGSAAGTHYGLGMRDYEMQFYVPSDAHFSFNTGGDLQWSGINNLVTILGTGNIGIGSTVPQARLDVEGGVYFGNGNVGIGSANPARLLDVLNSSDYPTARFRGWNDSQLEIEGQSGSRAWLVLNSAGNGSYAMAMEGTGATRRLGFHVDAAVNSTPQIVFDMSGNIGVGSSVPSQKVDVVGTVKATAFIGDGSGITGIPGVTQWSNGAASAIYYNLGNVGIGTSVPNNTLQVANLIKFDNTTYSTSLGYQAGANLAASGNLRNTFVGYQAGTAASTANQNAAVGFYALKSLTTGYSNVAAGAYALEDTQDGYANVALGDTALANNTSGMGNIALGFRSLGTGNTTGSNNIAMGGFALDNSTGDSNISLGSESSSRLTSGSQNTAVGGGALTYATSATNTVALGFRAGMGQDGLTSGINDTTLVGAAAGYKLTTGINNTVVGKSAGFELTSGSNNVLMGLNAADNLTSGSNNIVIGYNIDARADNSANTLNIGNLIFGTGIDGTATTLSSGNIGIGSTAPVQKFDVAGNIYVNGNIGIGTANPNVPLKILSNVGNGNTIVQVTDGSASALKLSRTGTGSNPALTIGSVSSNDDGWLYVSSISGWSGSYGTLNLVSPNTLGGITFKSSGNDELARMTNGGNLGIGSNAPQAKLDVEGGAYFGNGNVGVGTASPSAKLTLVGVGTTNATASFLIRDASQNPLVQVLDNGYVGIGSSAPAYPLDVNSATPGLANFKFSTFNSLVFIGGSAGIHVVTTGTGVQQDLSFDIGGTNNTKLFVKNTSGNVGIGTTVPLGKLHVEGSLYVGNGNVGVGSAVPSQAVDVIGTVKATAFIGDGSGISGVAAAGGWTSDSSTKTTTIYNVGIGSSAPSAKLVLVGSGTTSATSALMIRDSAYAAKVTVLDNGNVGIGTSLPLNKFDLRGDMTIVGATAIPLYIRAYDDASSYLSLNRNSATAAIEAFRDGADYQPLYFNSYDLRFLTGPYSAGHGEKMRIDSTGNVGINSSAPQAKLDVEGNVYVGNGNVGIGIDGAIAKVAIAGVSGIGSITRASSYMQVGGTDNGTNTYRMIGFGYTDPARTYYPAYMGFHETANAGLTLGDLVFGTRAVTTDTQPSERMRITSSGNVGIGTSVPAAQLDLESNSATLLGLKIGGYNSTITMGGNANGALTLTTNSGVKGIRIEGGGSAVSALSIDSNMQVQVDSPGIYGGRFIIIGDNVGIGSAAPQAKLDVEGNVYVGNGNVGIGTSVPAQALQVVGSVQLGTGLQNNYYAISTGFVNGTTGDTGNLILKPNGIGGKVVIGDYNNTDVILTAVEDVERVGIGSTSPQAKLDVEGNVYVGNGNVGIGSSSPMAKLVLIGAGTTGATNALMIRDSAFNAKVTIQDNGNFGIGTTAPSAAMEVKGQYFSTQYTTTTTLDWNNSNVQYIQLANGAQTFTFANPKGGSRYMLILKQPSSGAAATVTWPGTVLWPGGFAPVLTGTNNKTDVVTFVYDSVNNVYYAGSSLNY